MFQVVYTTHFSFKYIMRKLLKALNLNLFESVLTNCVILETYFFICPQKTYACFRISENFGMNPLSYIIVPNYTVKQFPLLNTI